MIGAVWISNHPFEFKQTWSVCVYVQDLRAIQPNICYRRFFWIYKQTPLLFSCSQLRTHLETRHPVVAQTNPIISIWTMLIQVQSSCTAVITKFHIEIRKNVVCVLVSAWWKSQEFTACRNINLTGKSLYHNQTRIKNLQIIWPPDCNNNARASWDIHFWN